MAQFLMGKGTASNKDEKDQIISVFVYAGAALDLGLLVAPVFGLLAILIVLLFREA